MFYQNGNVKSIESYSGKYFEWFENGVLHIEGYKISRTLYLYRKYDENGKLIDEKTKLSEEKITDKNRKKMTPEEAIESMKKFKKEKIEYLEKNAHRLSEWEKNELKAEILYKTKTFTERAEIAIKAGATVDIYVPETMPDKMYPPNPIRKPLKGERYFKGLENYNKRFNKT